MPSLCNRASELEVARGVGGVDKDVHGDNATIAGVGEDMSLIRPDKWA